MLADHLAALILREHIRATISLRASLVLFVLHALGLAAFWRLLNQPLWLVVPTLALLLVMPIIFGKGSLRRAIPTLAPLFFLYVILLVRYVAVRVVNAPVPYQDESTLANLRVLAFQIELAAIAACAYVLFAQVARFARGVLIGLTVLVSVAACAWFAMETFSHRTHGVTGTDPYAYAQMAVDLVERGTFLHAFPLFHEIKQLGIPWYPIQHIGYRLFENETGDAATVWPWGGSLWLALMYRVLGEEGLYVATPIAGLLSLVVCAWLAWECSRDQSRAVRASIIAITVALLATSWEQVDRSLVPLVDTQAQLFSTLAIVFALRGARSHRSALFATLAGLALGAAYLVRHTQVLLAIPIVVAAWRTRARWRFLIVCAGAAFLVGLPDLWYHQVNFGSWLTPESHELALFSLASIAKSAPIVVGRFFAGNEFGYLFPFALYGAYRFAHDRAQAFVALMVWLVVLVGFHLFYEALRMRDLLPEFPVIALLIAYGIVALARDVDLWCGRLVRTGGQSARPTVNVRCEILAMTLTGVVIFLALVLFLTRTQFTLMRVVQPAKVTFGYVTAAQRASFDQLAALTPATAVIGTTMNDGALDLYAQRATFRPSDWSDAELFRFVETMRGAGRAIYVLDDGAETSAARRALMSRYGLRSVAFLDVPLFSVVDGTPGMLWKIFP
ncbi:MAG: hypothetical protein HY868_12500 [Chloroflexi bacterium]|nr:hypothetical protein [Chloroflexota bacterium]